MRETGTLERVTVRELSSVEDVAALAALLEGIWREPRVLTPELLRALATHGNLVLGAFVGERMVGGQMAFLGLEDGRTILHSHVTGVLPEAQHHGVGLALKRAQRTWALARGISTVTWTFDPLIARNAYFNLRKLGAVGRRFLRDFYGRMEDAFNAGERSDRVEARWDLEDRRVEAALEGRAPEPETRGAVVLLDDDRGRPRLDRGAEGQRILVRIPPDYLALRGADRAAAGAWRDAVADALEDAFARGYRAVDFLRDGAYLLERA